MWNAAFGWGGKGHQIINGNFEKFLPDSLQFLSAQTPYFVAHASDADHRRSSDPTEDPKHFIDVDYYPEFLSGTLPHDYDSLCAEYGSGTVIDKGILPWAINATYGSLVTYMVNEDWENAYRAIADLGHYVGDAFQPLHCTQNYNGQMTGNGGIHFRYETDFLRECEDSISMGPAMPADQIDTAPLEFAFRIIGESNSSVQAILDADTYAKGIDPTYQSAYYTAMWSKVGELTNAQLRGACQALAALVYSAWQAAGSASVTRVLSPTVAGTFLISDLYPNPFNPSTNFSITIPSGSKQSLTRVAVYSPVGSLVRSEVRELSPGANFVSLDLSGCASGVYLIVVNENGAGRINRRTLKAVLLK